MFLFLNRFSTSALYLITACGVIFLNGFYPIMDVGLLMILLGLVGMVMPLLPKPLVSATGVGGALLACFAVFGFAGWLWLLRLLRAGLVLSRWLSKSMTFWITGLALRLLYRLWAWGCLVLCVSFRPQLLAGLSALLLQLLLVLMLSLPFLAA